MSSYNYFIVNAVCVTICIIILCNLGYKRAMMDSRLFRLLLIINMFVLISDNGIFILNGKTFSGAYSLNVVFSSVYFILNTLFSLVWLFYCQYKLFEDKKRMIAHAPFYFIPFIISFILSVTSPLTHLLFYIDQNNTYQRGSMIYLTYIIAFIYYILIWILIAMKRRSTDSPYVVRECRYLAMLPLPTLIGSIIQWKLHGISLIWVITTLLLLILFINIQNSQISTDPLTGLYNRRYLDRCLSAFVHDYECGTVLFAALIDIDSFKSINDKLGHATGDRAIVRAADILRRNCGHGDILARFGGDEFVVLGTRQSGKTMSKTLSLIREGVEQFNAGSHEKFTLSFSIGVAVFGECGIDSAEKLISAADDAMYREKQNKKKNELLPADQSKA